jgi:hypothetical protein
VWCKGAKNKKFEARNPKHEARNKFKLMKNKTTTMVQTGRIGFGVLDFPDLRFICFRVCFGPRGLFRYSDFGFY